jgi:hypothetical protein
MPRARRHRPTFTETRARRPLSARLTPFSWMILSILLLLLGLAGATVWRNAQVAGGGSIPLTQRLATPQP